MLARLLRRLWPVTPPDLAAVLRQTDHLAPADFIREGYRRVLGRDPDAGGFHHFRRELDAGRVSRAAFLDTLAGSAEYRRTRGKPPPCPLTALHRSRVALVRRLPPAETIVDLGGACTGRPEGALVAMGYPHPFRTLTNVEPPSEERHAIYRDVCDD